ncbi:MAG: C10 family peptidase, partial [Bacteroidales bacterium]|nr:C10 family peptidase [Bacteroidales bacterium]
SQFDKVATILYHCGAMVEMNYGAGGSGASTSLVPAAMAEHMSYSPKASSFNRSSYTNQQWFNMLKAELDLNHPLIYSGDNMYKNSGHAFVCDGYNSNNEIHINWGWGGSYNGWFAVCYLGEVGGEGTAVYSRNDSAIFGLVPATGSEGNAESRIGICDISANSTDGLIVTSGSVSKDTPFSVTVSTIQCAGPSDYTGYVNIGLVSQSGEVKEVIGKRYGNSNGFSIKDLPAGYYYSNIAFDCEITSELVFGDRICLCYTDSKGDWHSAGSSYTRNSNGTQVIGSISAYDLTMIEIPSSLSSNQIVYPGLIIGQKIPEEVTWYLDGTAFTDEYLTMSSGSHTFKVVLTFEDNSTETIVKKVTVK